MNKKLHIGIVCDQFGNLDRGGAETQVENTINALNKIEGVSTEIITYLTRDISKFDIVHFFKSNIEFSGLATLLLRKRIPYVVSTIIFPENYWSAILKYKVFSVLPKMLQRISALKFQFFLWNHAAVLFPNTDEEALFLKRIGLRSKVNVVPNGLLHDEMVNVDEDSFLHNFPSLSGEKFVLNVGRIDQRKNQKKLVIACMDLNLPIVLIGAISDERYFNEIMNLNYQKLFYLGPIFDKSILYGAYKACSVFCLPSTMETPGIAAMEAAYFNKPLVITKYGGTKSYFQTSAYYVNWRNINEIKEGISKMIKQPEINSQQLMYPFSWDAVADMYRDEYLKIITHNKSLDIIK